MHGLPLRFEEPALLWALIVPAILLIFSIYQFSRRRRSIRQYREKRIVPFRERFRFAGKTAAYFLFTFALALVLTALAMPQLLLSSRSKEKIRIVVLQDASPSMYVEDVRPNRWQRSMEWLKVFVDVFSWDGSRLGVVLFSNYASPSINLVGDPNVPRFFLNYLRDTSPLPLKDNTSWDTNLEEGLYLGFKLFDKQEDMSRELGVLEQTPKAFVVISDGEILSGEYSREVDRAIEEHIPIYVIGVGTLLGGIIPGSDTLYGEPIKSSLDRHTLNEIARIAGGQYFELGKQPNAEIAVQIIDDVRKRVQYQVGRAEKTEKEYQDMYWWFLLASAVPLGLALFWLFK